MCFRLKVCRQLILGLSAVHQSGSTHNDLHPRNVFYISKPSFCIKLGLVRHIRSLEYTDHCFEEVTTDKTYQLGVAKCDVFSAGCVISLMLSGRHVFGLDASDESVNIQSRTLANARCIEQSSVEASDLVKRMVLQNPSVCECMAHPVFWDGGKRFLYLTELVRCGKYLRLPTGENLGVGSDWRVKIARTTSSIAGHMSTTTASYSSKPGDLIRMLRNFYQHPPAELNLDDLAAELRKIFPVLFVKLYRIFGAVGVYSTR
mmetsp:Transcript_9651/g.16408  ORF Transcript_9651/g.16408 Transcript_9651/m.16408 type:complete len:260 (+) Transcript_9651:3-782(+)